MEKQTKNTLSVFCDESGFTGEDLLNPSQRYFSYASVAIHPDEAAALAAKVIRDFNVQGNELKGRKLLRYSRGRRAVEAIANELGEKTLLVVHDKQYALAGKFFEYAFEPLFSEINSVFYEVNFHKFVSTVLYCEMMDGNPRALDLAERFEEAVRSDETRFGNLISLHSPHDEPVEHLVSFCCYNRNAVLDELVDVRKNGGLMLDLTLSSLYSLLSHWGDKASTLSVSCDTSAPLRRHQQVLNMMVGRADKAIVQFGNRRRSYLFNLAHPVALVDSKSTPGVQLADVLATAICYAVENRREEWSRKIFGGLLAAGALSDDCVYPDLDYIDAQRLQPNLNYALLVELVRRSRHGQSLVNGIPEFLTAEHEILGSFHEQYLRYDIRRAGQRFP